MPESPANGQFPQQREMRLNVRYRGPSVDRGRMGAIELGPAIYGIGQMVGRASRILHGDETRVRVEVEANYQRASFGIEFFAVSPGGELIPTLSLEELANIAILIGFAGSAATGAVKGLIWIAKKLRGRDIDEVEREGDTMVINAEGESFKITVNEYRLLADPRVRQGMKGFVSPLESDGVDEVQAQVEDEEPVRIERSERRYFDLPPVPEQEISVDISRRVVEVIAPVFREENKWRFAEGDVTYYAEIEDEGFLDRVAKREVSFGKGDALLVEMETRTTVADDRYEYERKIIEVINHMKPSEGKQRDFFAQTEPDETDE